MDEIKTYLQRTGQELSDVMAGVSFYGFEKVLEFVRQAEKDKTKLIFYYEDDAAMQSDRPSYKFE